MPKSRNLFSLCGLVLITFFSALTASAQSSAFTYQGKLTSGGVDGAGTFDFKFRLYDLAGGGAQQGAELVRDDVAVTAGVFSVSLDFGNQFVASGERWLEIEVREGASNGSYTLLSPRQRISSSPFSVQTINAQFAVTAGNAQAVGGIPAANIVNTSDPRLTDARPPTAGSGNYVQNTTTQQPTSNFNISGLGKAAVLDANAYNIQGFEFIGIGGSGNANIKVGIDAGGNIGNGFQNVFLGYRAGSSNSSGGSNVFVGANAGFFNADGISNSLFGWSAGTRIVSGSRNSMFGFQAGNNTTSGDNAFFGADSGITNTVGNNLTLLGSGSNVSTNSLTNATAIGAKAVVSANNALILGSINGINGAIADTNVGIGTTAPTQRLHVVGNGLFSGNLTVNGALTAALPAGSPNYIQNSTNAQAASNFNISGTGKANSFDTATRFKIRGSDVFSIDGNQNVFLGVNVGNLNLGNNNAFAGSSAGRDNTNGQENSFFGACSGQKNNTGGQNSFFGAGSGDNNTSGTGNTFAGYLAGASNVSGNNNTMIGFGAMADSNSLSNATAIGAFARVTQSNSMVLGNINGVTSLLPTTNVGIGTTAPSFRFHVRADGQDGIKIQHTGVGAYPQLRWTDSTDTFKASIGVDTSGTGNMNFFVNGSDRIILKSNGVVQVPGAIFINNPNTVIITSPNGACWGITVNNSGVLSTFPVSPCP